MALSTIPFSGLGADASNQGVNFRNLIINGDMSIAQRGTSTSGVTTTDGYYACDRWRSQTDTGTWTISQSTDVPTGQGFVNSFKMDCTSAGTANSDEVSIKYYMEGQHLQHLAYGTSSAKSITFSFWIKTNKTGTFTLTLKNVNSTQERLVGYNYTVDSANTWEKKTITFAGDTSYGFDNGNTKELEVYWWFGTASALRSGTVSNTWQNPVDGNYADNNIAGLGGSTDDYVNLTGVQLEVGTSASDFEFLPYDVNEIRCKRYYDEYSGGSMFYYNRAVTSHWSYCAINVFFQTLMRANPSVTITSESNVTGDFVNNLNPRGFQRGATATSSSSSASLSGYKADAEL
jgi:hypothetical protein